MKMQPPLLRAKIPYAHPGRNHKDQQKRAFWYYSLSFYLSALLYIPLISIFYIMHIPIINSSLNSSIFDFYTTSTNILETILQVVSIIGTWILLTLLMRGIDYLLKKGRGRRSAFRAERNIISSLAHIYMGIASLLSLAVILIDLLQTHHWHGLSSLILGILLLFFYVLYGPALWQKILSSSAPSEDRPIGTEFARLTRYHSSEERANEL